MSAGPCTAAVLHQTADLRTPGPIPGQGTGGLTRLATSVCRLKQDPMEQGPTELHAGRSTFLLSSGGAGGGYY